MVKSNPKDLNDYIFNNFKLDSLERKIKYAISNKYRKYYEEKICLIDGCSNPASSAHSIQKSNVMSKLVCDQNTVKMFVLDPNTGISKLDTQVGHNKASTFSLCNMHDGIFTPIDFNSQRSFDENDSLQLSLFSLRSFYKEYWARRAVLKSQQEILEVLNSCDQDLIESQIGKMSSPEKAKRLLEMNYNEVVAAFNSLANEMNYLSSNINANRYSHLIFELSGQNIAASSVFIPHFFYPDRSYKKWMTLNVVPIEESTKVIIGYRKRDHTAFSKHLSPLKSFNIPELGEYFTDMLVNEVENIVFSPRYIQAIEDISLLEKVFSKTPFSSRHLTRTHFNFFEKKE